MEDKNVYLFISFMAFINLLIILSTKDYKQCFVQQKCTKLSTATVFACYIHCFIQCFSLYGFLFDNKIILLIYLLTPLTIRLTWLFLKNKYFTSPCVLTNFTDTICYFNNGDSMNFPDIYDYSRNCPTVNVMGYDTNIAHVVIGSIGYTVGILKLLFL